MAVNKERVEVPIILDGRFVLDGTFRLNDAFQKTETSESEMETGAGGLVEDILQEDGASSNTDEDAID